MTTEPVYDLLAVDDNELNLGFFRLLLNQLGHRVISLNNPFEAVELVQERHFDMIFTDVQMPGMTGIEAAANMRQGGYQGPIVAITAHLSNLEESELESSNVNDFLIKPVTKQDLARVLSEQLGSFSEGQVIGSSHEDIQRRLAEHETLDDTVNRQSIYDLKTALQRANQSPELATEMMKLLAESLSESLPLPDIGDHEALSAQLHKLAGGLRYSGATFLEQSLDEARRQLAAGDLASTDHLVEDIQSVIRWVKAHPEPFTPL